MDLESTAKSVCHARKLGMCQLLGDGQRFHGLVGTNMSARERPLRCGGSSVPVAELSPQIHMLKPQSQNLRMQLFRDRGHIKR